MKKYRVIFCYEVTEFERRVNLLAEDGFKLIGFDARGNGVSSSPKFFAIMERDYLNVKTNPTSKEISNMDLEGTVQHHDESN